MHHNAIKWATLAVHDNCLVLASKSNWNSNTGWVNLPRYNALNWHWLWAYTDNFPTIGVDPKLTVEVVVDHERYAVAVAISNIDIINLTYLVELTALGVRRNRVIGWNRYYYCWILIEQVIQQLHGAVELILTDAYCDITSLLQTTFTISEVSGTLLHNTEFTGNVVHLVIALGLVLVEHLCDNYIFFFYFAFHCVDNNIIAQWLCLLAKNYFSIKSILDNPLVMQ